MRHPDRVPEPRCGRPMRVDLDDDGSIVVDVPPVDLRFTGPALRIALVGAFSLVFGIGIPATAIIGRAWSDGEFVAAGASMLSSMILLPVGIFYMRQARRMATESTRIVIDECSVTIGQGSRSRVRRIDPAHFHRLVLTAGFGTKCCWQLLLLTSRGVGRHRANARADIDAMIPIAEGRSKDELLWLARQISGVLAPEEDLVDANGDPLDDDEFADRLQSW